MHLDTLLANIVPSLGERVRFPGLMDNLGDARFRGRRAGHGRVEEATLDQLAEVLVHDGIRLILLCCRYPFPLLRLLGSYRRSNDLLHSRGDAGARFARLQGQALVKLHLGLGDDIPPVDAKVGNDGGEDDDGADEKEGEEGEENAKGLAHPRRLAWLGHGPREGVGKYHERELPRWAVEASERKAEVVRGSGARAVWGLKEREGGARVAGGELR